MDLSKAFDCLPLCLLTAKLYAFGLTEAVCETVLDNLQDRKLMIKIFELPQLLETAD